MITAYQREEKKRLIRKLKEVAEMCQARSIAQTDVLFEKLSSALLHLAIYLSNEAEYRDDRTK